MYQTELIEKEVTIKELLKYYNKDKVEGYCKNCQNYKKIWSCPPHDFDPYDFLCQYKSAQVYCKKVIFNKDLSQDEVLDIFQKERRKFSDHLMSLEDNSLALIAGNCYQCEICSRQKNEACILRDKRRYSLEALGLMVGDITENIMKVPLQWGKTNKSNYLVTVGALLKK